MNQPSNPLHHMLADLADDVRPVDLYQPAIRRSRQIGRRRTAAAGVSLAVVAVLGGGLWRLDPPTPQPVAASIAGLPGTLFYRDDDTVVRLAVDTGPQTVAHTEAESRSAVSPDGTKVAVVGAKTGVVVSEDGRPRTLLATTTPSGYGPSWSADGSTLFTARRGPDGKPQPGLLNVADGTFSAVSVPPTATDVLLSGDGRSVVYADDACRVTVAPVTGGAGRIVPVLGDDDRSVNPPGWSVCDIVAVSDDATRAAVRLQVTDAAPELTDGTGADTIVDTATGQVLVPPAEGSVSAALFGPGDSMLYRYEQEDAYTLVVQDSHGRVTARVEEPASVEGLTLVAYTR
ncbi:MAG TPA: hypothetical protein VFO77_03195 [Actinoplanes sp.]|nr:hypothetical protein [Actinoplanes sp.]